MIRSLWIAKTGLDAQQLHMDVISNNLANVNTNGFKRSRAVFEDLLYQTLRQPGAQSSQQTQLPSGLQIGTGVRPVSTERIFSQGNLTQTGNPLDVAIQGNGFFQVLLPDGTTAYTRDGTFGLGADGTIVTADGYTVLPGLQVPVAATSVTVNTSGQVQVTLQGQTTPTTIGQIQIAVFPNEAGLDAQGDNLFLQTAASGAPVAGNPGVTGYGTVMQGFIENSNVNIVTEITNLITAQRAYEMNSKVITAADDMMSTLTNLR